MLEGQLISIKPPQDSVEQRILTWLKLRRKIIVWIAVFLLVVWVAAQIKEVTTLLLFSYAVSVLLDPLVSRLEKWGISRSFAVFSIGAIVTLLLLWILLTAVPAIIREYAALVSALPGYIDAVSQKIGGWAQAELGISIEAQLHSLGRRWREFAGALSVEHVQRFLLALGRTALAGYSVTLTIFNLFLLPFFIYYLTRDLARVHRLFINLLPYEHQATARSIGSEITGHVHAFFKGQLTVSAIMALLYTLGLSLVGLPSALIVGLLSGFLNLVPYLGLVLGMLLSIVITLVSDPSWSQVGMVVLVFVIVQALEGTILTPKIVGESVGLHPLAVMIALIIGGQLLGLLGIVVAIPAAASVRVLFRYLMEAVQDESVIKVEEALDKPVEA